MTDEVAPAAVGGAVGAHPQPGARGGGRGGLVGGNVAHDVAVHVDGGRRHGVGLGHFLRRDGLEGMLDVHGLHIDGLLLGHFRSRLGRRGVLGGGILGGRPVVAVVVAGQLSPFGNGLEGQLVVDGIEFRSHGHGLFLVFVYDDGGHLLGDGGVLGLLGHGARRGIGGLQGEGEAAGQAQSRHRCERCRQNLRCLHNLLPFTRGPDWARALRGRSGGSAVASRRGERRGPSVEDYHRVKR